jgi:hypothetical protein
MNLVLYSWTAFSGAASSPVAMGITDDRARAMEAGEESLGAGRAVAVIIEAVRPAMAPRTLAPYYLATGVGWVGQRTGPGEVTWTRFFSGAGQDGRPGPGRIEP